jgi:hypothetical protein
MVVPDGGAQPGGSAEVDRGGRVVGEVESEVADQCGEPSGVQP